LLLFHQRYVIFTYIILTEARKILHCWYHNVRMYIVACFIAVCFKEILVSAPWR